MKECNTPHMIMIVLFIPINSRHIHFIIKWKCNVHVDALCLWMHIKKKRKAKHYATNYTSTISIQTLIIFFCWYFLFAKFPCQNEKQNKWTIFPIINSLTLKVPDKLLLYGLYVYYVVYYVVRLWHVMS